VTLRPEQGSNEGKTSEKKMVISVPVSQPSPSPSAPVTLSITVKGEKEPSSAISVKILTGSPA